MNRQYLAQLLSEGDEAWTFSREALLAGAHYEVWPGNTPTQRLISIYQRRERRNRISSQPSIRFHGAVDALRQYEYSELALGFIDDRGRGGSYFQLFMSPERTSIIAVLGIKVSGNAEMT